MLYSSRDYTGSDTDSEGRSVTAIHLENHRRSRTWPEQWSLILAFGVDRFNQKFATHSQLRPDVPVGAQENARGILFFNESDRRALTLPSAGLEWRHLKDHVQSIGQTAHWL